MLCSWVGLEPGPLDMESSTLTSYGHRTFKKKIIEEEIIVDHVRLDLIFFSATPWSVITTVDEW